jgi:hypothetical protein
MFWVRRGSDSSPSALLYGRPKFESRLGTPEEALYRAEAMRITRVVRYSMSSLYKYCISARLMLK